MSFSFEVQRLQFAYRPAIAIANRELPRGPWGNTGALGVRRGPGIVAVALSSSPLLAVSSSTFQLINIQLHMRSDITKADTENC